MANCSETTETKPQAIRSSSAQETQKTQEKSKSESREPMANTSISAKPGGADHEGDGHRFSGGRRKQQYQRRRHRDQGAYHDRKGRQQSEQQEKRYMHQQKRLPREKASENAERFETPQGGDGAEGASSGAVGGQDKNSQDVEQREGSLSKRDRNRHRRQRKQGGRKEDRQATGTQNEDESLNKDIMEERSEAGKDSNPLANEGDSSMPHRGRGGGGSSAGGRRARRSDRDQQQWRSEQRQRPPRKDGGRYYHGNRDYWRGEERRDSRWRDRDKEREASSHDQQRSHSRGDNGKKDVSEEKEGASSSNLAGDQNSAIGDMQVELPSKSATCSNSSKPESERKTAEKTDRRSQSSKPKSYDYTKPRHSGNDLPAGSKYKSRSQHRLKVGNKEFTPTIQSDELSQQLTAETYECMVCCDRVRERDQIWSCQNCYHIFHLKCIKKWATAPTFTSTEEGEDLVFTGTLLPDISGTLEEVYM